MKQMYFINNYKSNKICITSVSSFSCYNISLFRCIDYNLRFCNLLLYEPVIQSSDPFYPVIRFTCIRSIRISSQFIRLLSGYLKLSGYPANFFRYPADILLLLFLFKSIYQIYLILSVVNGLGKVPVGSIPTSNLKKIRQR